MKKRKETDKGINIALPEKTHNIVFQHALNLSGQKKKTVTLPESVIHIIDEWGQKSDTDKK